MPASQLPDVSAIDYKPAAVTPGACSTDALKALESALSALGPSAKGSNNSAGVRNWMAMVLLEQGRTADALSQTRRALDDARGAGAEPTQAMTLAARASARLNRQSDTARFVDDLAKQANALPGDLLKRDLFVLQGRLEKPKGHDDGDWEDREQTLFRSTQFGDDVDRALLKSDGSYTYFAADMAYHHNKVARGYRHLINVFGAGSADVDADAPVGDAGLDALVGGNRRGGVQRDHIPHVLRPAAFHVDLKLTPLATAPSMLKSGSTGP